MSTSLYLWSSPSSSSPTKREDGSPVRDSELKETRIAKPKLKRNSKKPAFKKIPQRGLGVAQLERLRIQEHIQNLTDVNPAVAAPEIARSPAPAATPEIHRSFFHMLPIYDPIVPRCVDPVVCGGPPAFYHLPPCRTTNPGFIGYGPVLGSHSLLHNQYTLDRFRMAAGSVSAVPELSSIQRLHCSCDQCESCIRKRLLGENLGNFKGTSAANFFGNLSAVPVVADQGREYTERKGKRIIEERNFFQQDRSASNGNDSEIPDRTVGIASSGAGAPDFLDLSLSLSTYNTDK